MNTHAIETLGQKLGTAALTTLVRICPAIRSATQAQQNAACAAMRSKVPQVLDELLDNAQAAPWVADAAFALAALTLAQAGQAALQQEFQLAPEQRQIEATASGR